MEACSLIVARHTGAAQECEYEVACRVRQVRLWRGNLYPAKQRPEQKIDAAVALTMAVGRAMAEDDKPDIMEFLRDPIFG